MCSSDLTTAGVVRYGYGAMQVGATASARTLLFLKWESSGAAITVSDGGPPPAYDPCSSFNPTLASGANSVPVNVDTAQDLALNGCGTAVKANYYKYTAPWTGAYSFSTCSSAAATRMAVVDGCQSSANQLACNDDSCGSSSSIDISLTSGQVVYIVVGGEGGSNLPSPLAINVTAPPPPPNPNCATATALAFGSNAVNNAGITGDQVVKSGTTSTAIVYKARWLKFTPTVSGAYTFSGCGSINDTKLAIATDCPAIGATFNSIAYNDDACPCASGCGTTTQLNYSSRLNTTNSGIPLTQELIAGQTYLLVFGGYWLQPQLSLPIWSLMDRHRLHHARATSIVMASEMARISLRCSPVGVPRAAILTAMPLLVEVTSPRFWRYSVCPASKQVSLYCLMSFARGVFGHPALLTLQIASTGRCTHFGAIASGHRAASGSTDRTIDPYGSAADLVVRVAAARFYRHATRCCRRYGPFAAACAACSCSRAAGHPPYGRASHACRRCRCEQVGSRRTPAAGARLA